MPLNLLPHLRSHRTRPGAATAVRAAKEVAAVAKAAAKELPKEVAAAAMELLAWVRPWPRTWRLRPQC